MKEVKIKSLSLKNFRGVNNFHVKDVGDVMNIHGANGTGKTSLYDAWLWVLFGKDHEDRSDHELKPRSLDGKQATRTNTEVEVELDVSGQPLKLTRIYREKWVKPNGEQEQVFDGNTTDYRINDVDVKKGEYDAKVNELCDEVLFKIITNPHYFTNLKRDEQREILSSLVPELSDEMIAAGNDDFVALLKEITGVTLEAYKDALAARRKKVTEGLERIPVEIETTNANMPERKDWKAIEDQIEAKQAEINSIDKQLSDVAEKSAKENEKRIEIQGQINELERANAKLEAIEKDQVAQDIQRKQSEVRGKLMEAGDLKREYENKKARLDALEKDKEYYSGKISALREQWQELNSSQPSLDDDEFICPTCKRLLAPSDVEEKRDEMIANFNRDKSERLKKNVEEGKSLNERISSIEEEIERVKLPEIPSTEEQDEEIARLREEIRRLQERKPSYMNSIEFQANTTRIEELKEKLSEEPGAADNSATLERKKGLIDEVDSLKRELHDRDVIERLEKSIADIEKRKKALSKELASIEKSEHVAKEFERAKNEDVEKRVNELFENVRFKLFKKQVNGKIVPDCEATMNGRQYSTLSNAEKIYAGLDIIRAISDKKGIHAPIFIDNRESTTNIPEMKAQVINLYVDPTCEVLTIK